LTINTMFSTLVQDDIQSVEDLMRQQAEGRHEDLVAALDVLISSGGKRIRPTITILVGRMLGAPHKQLITLAAAIEMLHTATLVHDDLIDGSLLRRGMPTLNSQWSPGATVLTGDFMFARAAELAANTDSLPAMKLFAQTLSEIVNGEMNQLFQSHCSLSRDKYFDRIYAKTASLFRTSCCSAALISPVSDRVVDGMCTFGYEIGMAFQIVDDILDFTGEQRTLGKPVGGDLSSGLFTLPTIIYLEDHQDEPEIKELSSGDCDILEDDERLASLVEAIRSSDAIQKSHQEAEKFVKRGLDELLKQPISEERRALEEIADYIIQRNI
jgi:geranylgeranyl pyrophosphate synthase